MPYVIAVDIGGTFTDLVACDLDTGAAAYTKSPTTYGRLGEAVFDCIRKAALDARDATFVKHGTTLVINALLQRNGSKTALLTTKGFRDVLEIGRGNRTQPFNLRFRREPPLIPRELRFEIEERIDGAGKVRTPLSTMALGEIAASLRAHEVEALAISFLNAYLDPAHEQAAAAELRRLLPEVFVTTGSELTREWHEFERTATSAANAYVGPQVGRYIAEFDQQLRSGGFGGSLLLMGSHGGVISAERGCREPITLVESGPVGGCIGAGAYGSLLGIDNLVAFDMGGTTAKCAMIERGRYAVESIYHIGGPRRRFPDPRQRRRHSRGRRRRRLDRLARWPEQALRGAAQRRLDAGPGLLRARRPRAHRDRRQPAARPPRRQVFPRRRDGARSRQSP